MAETRSFRFLTCPKCNGYGVRDNGRNCSSCGGVGSGGLQSGRIGSGEIIVDVTTGQKVSLKDFTKAGHKIDHKYRTEAS